jgi:hypothetical protein
VNSCDGLTFALALVLVLAGGAGGYYVFAARCCARRLLAVHRIASRRCHADEVVHAADED